MLELTEEYAHKCYTYRKKCTETYVYIDFIHRNPNWQNKEVLDQMVADQERTNTGIYLIYENRGFGKFYFRYHGDKLSFEIFIRLSNLHMTDKLVIQPAQCNADNIKFGLKNVFTITNVVPVCRIEPARYQVPAYIPDVAVGKPVVVTFHILNHTCPRWPFPEKSSAPEYCPPVDEIDQRIRKREENHTLTKLSYEKKKNMIPFDPSWTFDDLNECEAMLFSTTSERNKPTSSRSAPKQASEFRSETGEKSAAKSSQRVKSQGKRKQQTSLRAALQASGFKPETAENSTEKPAEKEVAKDEQPKCSKSKHQGNAKTFKRKTKRSGRV